MYSIVYANIQINDDTHGKVMYLIGVKQGSCPPHYCINELETCLDEINRYSSCLFNIVVVILLYVDDVVMLSKLGT